MYIKVMEKEILDEKDVLENCFCLNFSPKNSPAKKSLRGRVKGFNKLEFIFSPIAVEI